MPRNKMTDLNNHLFEQLERLNDENLSPEELKTEVERSKAMAGLATQIVKGAKVSLDAMKLVSRGDANHDVLQNLIGSPKEE